MEKVKISKDGSAIDFVQSDKIPVSLKKFRQSPELEGFYRFIFENDLRKEALQVIDRIYLARKAAKLKKPLAQLLAEKKMAAEKKAVVEANAAAVVVVETKKTSIKIEATKAPAKVAAKAKTIAAAPAKSAAKAKIASTKVKKDTKKAGPSKVAAKTKSKKGKK